MTQTSMKVTIGKHDVNKKQPVVAHIYMPLPPFLFAHPPLTDPKWPKIRNLDFVDTHTGPFARICTIFSAF